MKNRIVAILFGALSSVSAFAQQADTVVLPMAFHGSSEPLYILALRQPPTAPAGLPRPCCGSAVLREVCPRTNACIIRPMFAPLHATARSMSIALARRSAMSPNGGRA